MVSDTQGLVCRGGVRPYIPARYSYRMMNRGDGSALKRIREERDLTQAGLAEMVGTSQPQIDRLEKRLRVMTKEWAVRLARVLRCHWTDLQEDMAEHERRTIKLAERIQSLNEDDRGAVQRIVEAMENRNAD